MKLIYIGLYLHTSSNRPLVIVSIATTYKEASMGDLITCGNLYGYIFVQRRKNKGSVNYLTGTNMFGGCSRTIKVTING